jgi:hypothetical protein
MIIEDIQALRGSLKLLMTAYYIALQTAPEEEYFFKNHRFPN